MGEHRFLEFIYGLVKLDSNYFNLQENYIQFIFPPVFWMTFLVTLLICAFYYNVINNFTGRIGLLRYWLIFLFLAGLFDFYYAVHKVARVLYPGLTIGNDGWLFGFNNFIVGAILFFVFSMVLKTKKISIHARQLPFQTPW
jgi:hypothetical protein